MAIRRRKGSEGPASEVENTAENTVTEEKTMTDNSLTDLLNQGSENVAPEEPEGPKAEVESEGPKAEGEEPKVEGSEDDEPKVEEPKTFEEQLKEHLTALERDEESGEYPFAVTLLSMWKGLSGAFENLFTTHKQLSYTGPSEKEMADKRKASEDPEIKALNAEIADLEKLISDKKNAANRKIEGPKYIEPLSADKRQEVTDKFSVSRDKAKKSVDGFAAVMSMNGDYGKGFTDFLLESIPDLRKSAAVKKPASAGTGEKKGRKPFFAEMHLGDRNIEKLGNLRQLLSTGYAIGNPDAYELRVLAEKNGASESNNDVTFDIPKKHNRSETQTLRLVINYDANWDAEKLATAEANAK